MTIGACLARFMKHMRPIIVIDRTFLKEKYGDVLQALVTKDGNE